MGEITDAAMNEMRAYGRQEARAYKKSWKWFLLAPVVIVAVALAAAAGVPDVVLVVPALLAVLAIPYAIYRHGKAGGDTSAMTAGGGTAD